MEERVKIAFAFASESSKQLIALSTGIVALTITFLKDFLDRKDAPNRYLLAASWVTYLISIIAGIGTLLSLTGALQPKQDIVDVKPSIWSKPIRTCMTAQVITFVLATFLMIIFGVITTWG